MAKRPEALIFGKTLYNRKEALQSCGISREAAKPFLIIPIGGNERLLGFQPVFIDEGGVLDAMEHARLSDIRLSYSAADMRTYNEAVIRSQVSPCHLILIQFRCTLKGAKFTTASMNRSLLITP